MKAKEPDTYKHLNGDRDGAVERRVASVLGHDREVDQPVGYLFVIQWAAHTDHWNIRNEDLSEQSPATQPQRFPYRGSVASLLGLSLGLLTGSARLCAQPTHGPLL